MKVYVVNGFPGSGKTTFEQKIKEMTSYKCKIISTVDFVKEIAKECGWDGSKTPENRKFLSNLKNLLTEWNDVPFKKVEQAIAVFERDAQFWFPLNYMNVPVFIDSREPKEIDRFKKTFDAKTILIRRPGDEEAAQSNDSDKNVLNYNYDIVINNNGTIRDLALKAEEFMIRENLYMPEPYEIDLFGDVHIG